MVRRQPRRLRPMVPVVAALLCMVVVAAAVTPEQAEVVLADFESDVVGGFPEGWLVKDSLGRLRDRAHPNWLVAEEEGRRFLTARAEASAATVGREVDWDVAAFPRLRWRWRVRSIPTGADERVKDRSDSAAGLYVFFEGGPFWNPYALKYVWSTSLPQGARTRSPYSSNTHIIVLRSGGDEIDRWLEEERDVLADFALAFGDRQPAVRAIGLLTDSDNTQSVSVADYGAVMASRGDQLD